MTDDFDILTYSYDCDHITLYPVGDVHIGSLECRETEWEKFCKEIQKDESARLLLVGDLLDTGITNSKTDVYGQKYTPMYQKKLMTEYLEPIADKCLCLIEGNHERRVALATSYSPTFEICSKLDIEDKYRANAAFITMRFGGLDSATRNRKTSSARPTYNIYASHGKAKTRDGNIGCYMEGADLTISGHTHNPDSVPKMRLRFDNHNNQIIKSPFCHITVGSWLSWGGYGMFGSYAPPAECIQKVVLHGDRKQMESTQLI